MIFADCYPFERMKYFVRTMQQTPDASAEIGGSAAYGAISGKVDFYQTTFGVLVSAQIFGLPNPKKSCESQIFAFHIHGGTACTGNEKDPFADVLTHYNPGNCEHPEHAGDLPPLFGNNGYAFEAFLTDRFSVDEIIGRTVIIHRKPDDFTTQPSGNAGEKIACGIIKK